MNLQNTDCFGKYTAHCLCSTTIHDLYNQGFEIHHIMYICGHRNEASVKSYNSDLLTAQNQQLCYQFVKVAKTSSSESSSSTVASSTNTTLQYQAHVELNSTVSPSQSVFNINQHASSHVSELSFSVYLIMVRSALYCLTYGNSELNCHFSFLKSYACFKLLTLN